MNKNGWIGKVLLGLGVLVPAIGMGVSIYLAANGESMDVSGGNTEPTGSGYVLTGADFPDPVADIGNQPGYQVPDFTLTLADGSAVTSADLVNSGRPTFLFFWATV